MTFIVDMVRCGYCSYTWVPRIPNPKLCPRCTHRLERDTNRKQQEPKQEEITQPQPKEKQIDLLPQTSQPIETEDDFTVPPQENILPQDLVKDQRPKIKLPSYDSGTPREEPPKKFKLHKYEP